MGSAEELLIINVETLKKILVARATGSSANNTEDIEYKSLRHELLQNQRIGSKLPEFLRKCRELSEFWNFIKNKFSTYAERREYLREQFDPVLTFLEMASEMPSDTEISCRLARVDSEHIHEAWQKALNRRSIDPDGSITIARSLLETTCKYILDKNL